MAEEERGKPAQIWLKNIRIGLTQFALCIAIATGIIYLTQDKMIYHPLAYKPDMDVHPTRKVEPFTYRTASGAQTAYYAGPAGGGTPARLWIMFGGNGGLILMYHHLIEQPELANDGMLMVDYPGYGGNEGKPSGASIQENADAALATLAAKLGTTPAALLPTAGVFGHSLGTGVGLEFAVAHPEIKRVMLVAPFTSLYAMAFRVVGPIAHLLHHNYDNEARLRDLARETPRPTVDMVTGDQDQVIPIAMSRHLKAEFPWITYQEMPGLEHNQIVTQAAHTIAVDMAGMR